MKMFTSAGINCIGRVKVFPSLKARFESIEGGMRAKWDQRTKKRSS